MTQSDYDNLNPKNTGRIYFTSDTHRIYKGSDLYAATTFDQLNFSAISATSITVDGSAVSLEGHSHSASEISGLDAVISAATSSFALTGHTHAISDITSLATKVSGLTSSKVEKTNGVFTNLSTTNLVVSSAEIEAISIEASSMTVNGTGTFNAVSASTATFGDINVTGTASLSTTNVTASTLTAGAGSFTTLTVGGSSVALVGHTHPASEVTGLQSVLDGLSSTYASISHGHAISDITSLSTVLTGISESSIEKDTVTADIGYFRLLSVSGSANFAVNTVSANAVTVNGTEVALSGHTHSVADIDGLSTALGGFASSGHTHGELTGITQTSISKANANFTTLSASAGTFNTITTSDLNFTNMSISSAAVSSMTVANLSVTGSMLYNNKEVATQEYVQ